MAVIAGNEAANDKNTKKRVVIDTITKNCASSSHDIFRKINDAITSPGSDSKLEATILTGGYTNYSYKVYVNDQPELCVFAKLSFEFALWNPESAYDLKRTENEYEIIKSISSESPDTVVTPLSCWNVSHEGQKMKLLVTEWSKGDEQFCNQFIDGAVDPRIAPKLASTIALLHNIKGFDPDFNVQVKDTLLGFFEHVMKSAMLQASKSLTPKDRTEAFLTSFSEDNITTLVNASISNFRKRDCMTHGDCHVFNVLVESKPSIDLLESSFGDNGTMVLCDWEMSVAGPIGNDLGLAISFPIACMIAHALNGHNASNQSIKLYIDTLLDTYLSRMVEAGKTPVEMASITRNICGSCGLFQYGAFYVQGIMAEFFPVESEESRKYVVDALGSFGLKLFRLAYDTKYLATSTSSEDVRSLFASLLEEEVARAHTIFTSGGRKMSPRKSSILRAAHRRHSDAAMRYLIAESVKRLSVTESIDSPKRLSISESIECAKRLSITEEYMTNLLQ